MKFNKLIKTKRCFPGFVSMTGPLYIAEQLPNNWRGPMVVCYQLLITIGILVGSILAGIFEPVPNGWR